MADKKTLYMKYYLFLIIIGCLLSVVAVALNTFIWDSSTITNIIKIFSASFNLMCVVGTILIYFYIYLPANRSLKANYAVLKSRHDYLIAMGFESRKPIDYAHKNRHLPHLYLVVVIVNMASALYQLDVF